MRLAILGDDPVLLPLARAAGPAGHDVAWIGEPESLAGPLAEIAPRAARDEPWELLLEGRLADAVLVGGDAGERRDEQLRRLVQEGVPLLVAHPVRPSMLLYYELDMIRREAGGVLRHYVPGRGHPHLEWLAAAVRGDDDALGRVEQLLFERLLDERTRADILAQFCRDVDLVATCSGPLDRLAALGTPDDPTTYATLGVQLSGPSGIPVRWNVGPAAPHAGGRLRAVGGRGEAVVWMPADGGPWRLESTLYGEGPREEPVGREAGGAESETADGAADALAALARSVAGSDTPGDAGEDWLEACRSVELADSIERSLTKGRAVQLHDEEYTEQATFRGKMAAAGCALLLAVPPLLVLIGLAGRLLGLPTRYFFVGLLIVLSVFLALQLLPPLVLGSRDAPPAPGDDAPRS